MWNLKRAILVELGCRGNERQMFQSGCFSKTMSRSDSLIVLGDGLEQINALIQDHPYIGQNMISRTDISPTRINPPKIMQED